MTLTIGYCLITLLVFGGALFVLPNIEGVWLDIRDWDEVLPVAAGSLLWPLALIVGLLALPFGIVYAIVRKVSNSEDEQADT